MGIFGICAEDRQELADQAVKDWGLHYQVCMTFDLSHIISEGLLDTMLSGRKVMLNGV